MKVQLTLFLFLSLVVKISSAQVARTFVDFNDTRALFQNNGFFAFNDQLSFPAYEIPKGGGNHTIFVFSPIWIGQIDDSLVGTAAIYESQNAFSGPVASDYSDPWHEDRRRMYTAYKAQIDNHIQNWEDPNYVVPDEVLEWPAMGNPALNTSQYNAPFVDFNGSGVYEPKSGDYPLITGDIAVFAIYSYDVNPIDNDLNNTEFPLEVQVMAYQFASSDEWLNQTTFLNYRVKNRSNKTIEDFQWGSYVDIDIGYAFDDFFGSDSTRNLVYGYNGPDFDPGGFGGPGYGQNPPAQGVVLLNKDMYAANKMTYSGIHDLNNLVNLYNLMQGRNSAGAPNLDSQGNTTRFIYKEPPYINGSESMHQLGLEEDVQRNIISAAPVDLAPGASECYHYAFVYGRNFTDHLLSVEEVINRTDSVQQFYDENIDLPCDFYNGSMNTTSFEKQDQLSIYPNPTNNQISIKSNQPITGVKIYSSEGKLSFENSFEVTKAHTLDLSSLQKGVYIVNVYYQNGTHSFRRVVKNE